VEVIIKKFDIKEVDEIKYYQLLNINPKKSKNVHDKKE
jgi:hypothetical protein